MGRDYKFRAWDGTEMYTPILADGKIYRSGRDFEDENDAPHDDLMQYTGLKDNQNENEIYGDDIAAFAIFDYNGADTQYKGVVKFAEGEWQLWRTAEDPYFGSDGPFSLYAVLQQDDGFEVIGNRFQHPELLKEGEG